MIHHVSVGSDDLERARRFYDPVLATVGLRLLDADDTGLGYGAAEMVFSVQRPVDGKPASAGNGSHICLVARNRKAVDAFHRTALANGGRDDGPPGLRPKYDANYYGAFVRDPDSNKIEAVTYSAE